MMVSRKGLPISAGSFFLKKKEDLSHSATYDKVKKGLSILKRSEIG